MPLNEPPVLVFARPPIPGRAKTRLIPALGAHGAARLHARLVAKTVATVAAVDRARPIICAASSPGHPLFVGLARRHRADIQVQRGVGLGQRMHLALSRALRQAPYALLIGSDCPSLTAADLEQGLRALRLGADAVLGPANDGGYWAIGLRRPGARLFGGVDWGTERVLAQTRVRLRRLGWSSQELTTRSDLDRPADLRGLGLAPWPGLTMIGT